MGLYQLVTIKKNHYCNIAKCLKLNIYYTRTYKNAIFVPGIDVSDIYLIRTYFKENIVII